MPVSRRKIPANVRAARVALASDLARDRSPQRLELMAELLGRLFGERYGHPTGDAQAEFDGTRLLVSFTAGLAPYERELVGAGREWLVEDMRAARQEVLAPVFKGVAEEHTGRRVLSQAGSCLPEEGRCRLIFILAPEEHSDA